MLGFGEVLYEATPNYKYKCGRKIVNPPDRFGDDTCSRQVHWHARLAKDGAPAREASDPADNDEIGLTFQYWIDLSEDKDGATPWFHGTYTAEV